MISPPVNPLLRGLRILDLTRLLPGPFCTLYLAQMGAEVIKIEEPGGGDYARQLSPELFSLVNRGKRALAMDLRKTEAKSVFHRLVEGADAVIESFRPGVMDRLGCGFDVLRAINPKLVYAALTGYGQTGPWKDRAGHDLNYCGYAGLLEQTGSTDGPPVPGAFQTADLAGGALTCAIGVLAAIHGARTSGCGCMIDAAMLDGTLALQAATLASLRALGRSPPRGGDLLNGGLPNYAVYACADGGHVALAALEPRFWQNFCAVVKRPDLLRMPLVPGLAGAPTRAALCALFKTRSRDEWEALLADADACVSAVLSPQEALQSPQVRARRLVETDADGKPAPRQPLRIPQASWPPQAPAPDCIGADSREILYEAGFSAAEIEELLRRAVVGAT